jgi:dipeptidyl-peptidase-4
MVGITRYQWSKNKSQPLMFIPIGNDLYIHDKRDLRLLVSGSYIASIIDPRLSPDGTLVAYVQDFELYCISTIASSPPAQPRQLTFDARHHSYKSNGLAEFIAQEEMDRNEGFWWSDNSRFIAFTQVDESNVPIFRISHSGSYEPCQVIPFSKYIHHFYLVFSFCRPRNIDIPLLVKLMFELLLVSSI